MGGVYLRDHIRNDGRSASECHRHSLKMRQTLVVVGGAYRSQDLWSMGQKIRRMDSADWKMSRFGRPPTTRHDDGHEWRRTGAFGEP